MTLDDIDLLDMDRFRRLEHHEMFTRSGPRIRCTGATDRNGPGFWSITKHADLGHLNRDAEGFSSEAGGINMVEFDDERPPTALDPARPDDADDRPAEAHPLPAARHKGFTPRMIGLIEEHLRTGRASSSTASSSAASATS